jgi:hypothetical protein
VARPAAAGGGADVNLWKRCQPFDSVDPQWYSFHAVERTPLFGPPVKLPWWLLEVVR